MCLYSMYSVMYPSHHWKKWVLPLFFNKSFLCLIVECIYRPSKTLTHQTNHKELAATKADCCVASRLQDALEHTKKTKVDSLWACTFCTCMTGNTSLPIHKTLLWLNSILSHFFFSFFLFSCTDLHTQWAKRCWQGCPVPTVQDTLQQLEPQTLTYNGQWTNLDQATPHQTQCIKYILKAVSWQ